MISQVTGEVIERSRDRVIVDVNGLGLACYIPLQTYEDLPPAGEVTLYTHLHITDNKTALYGFSTREQRSLFEILTSVSRVGPSKGLNILGEGSASRISGAIKNEDISFLSRARGVGEKTAERICLEARDDVSELAASGSLSDSSESESEAELGAAREALQELGFSSRQADKALESVRERHEEVVQSGELVELALTEEL